MRYLFILSTLGEAIALQMKDAGVDLQTCQGWLLYWEDLIAQTARVQPGSMGEHSGRFFQALRTSAWYIARAESANVEST
jgi:hypothetical protein